MPINLNERRKYAGRYQLHDFDEERPNVVSPELLRREKWAVRIGIGLVVVLGLAAALGVRW